MSWTYSHIWLFTTHSITLDIHGNIFIGLYFVSSSIFSFLNTGDSSAHLRSAGNWAPKIVLLTNAVIYGAMADTAILNHFGGSWSKPFAFLGFIFDNNFSILLTDTCFRVNTFPLYLFSILMMLGWLLYYTKGKCFVIYIYIPRNRTMKHCVFGHIHYKIGKWRQMFPVIFNKKFYREWNVPYHLHSRNRSRKTVYILSLLKQWKVFPIILIQNLGQCYKLFPITCTFAHKLGQEKNVAWNYTQIHRPMKNVFPSLKK